MCRSTVKWLVANLKLEECMRKRKEEIASALRREIQGIATENWGVELVAIDIQDVYIQDADLFASMQATFKAEKEREANLARLEADRAIEQKKLASEFELQKSRSEVALEKAQREAQVARAAIELAMKRDEEQFKLDQLRTEQARQVALAKAKLEQEQAAIAAKGRRDAAAIEAEAAKIRKDEELRALEAQLLVESKAGPASLERLFLTQSLPALSTAIAKSMEGAHLSVYQSGSQGGGLLPMAVQQVSELLQSRLNVAQGVAKPTKE